MKRLLSGDDDAETSEEFSKTSIPKLDTSIKDTGMVRLSKTPRRLIHAMVERHANFDAATANAVVWDEYGYV